MDLKKYIGGKIKAFRNARGMSQDGLAEILETTKQTVSRYENGDRQANQDVLFKLSSIFNVGVDDFFPNTKKEIISERNYTYIPTAISAGLPINVEGITEYETISLPDSVMGKWSGNQDVYILKINGDSMNNIMPDNSLIAVKPITLDGLNNGDIVLFSTNHEYSVKRFYKFDDVVVFRPDSNNLEFYETRININEIDNLEIHGKVVLYIVELD